MITGFVFAKDQYWLFQGQAIPISASQTFKCKVFFKACLSVSPLII